MCVTFLNGWLKRGKNLKRTFSHIKRHTTSHSGGIYLRTGVFNPAPRRPLFAGSHAFNSSWSQDGPSEARADTPAIEHPGKGRAKLGNFVTIAGGG